MKLEVLVIQPQPALSLANKERWQRLPIFEAWAF